MKKINKLQKFLSTFTPSLYWTTSYEGKPTDINIDDTDWNQTLITQINGVAKRIYMDCDDITGPEIILISGQYSDMQGLIHSLLYMKSVVTQHSGFYCIGRLAGKYDVLVIPNLHDEKKIYVCKVYDTTKDPFDINNYQKVGVLQIQKQNEHL